MVGLTLGTYWLGQLKIAWRIFDFVSQVSIVPISSVALSLFARVASQAERLARRFVETVKVMAVVACPIFFGLAVLASDLVTFVLGPKWADATTLIQLLALLPLAAIMNSLFGPLLIAMGRTGEVFAVALLHNVLTAILTAVSAPFGIAAVMLAYIVRAYFVAGLNLLSIKRATPVTIGSVVGVVAPPVLASLVMAIVVIAARGWLTGHLGFELRLVTLVATGSLVYFAVLILGDFVGLWPGYVRKILVDLNELVRSRKETPKLKEAHE